MCHHCELLILLKVFSCAYHQVMFSGAEIRNRRMFGGGRRGGFIIRNSDHEICFICTETGLVV